MAVAWQYSLLGFTATPSLRVLLRSVARRTAFGLEYFDRYLISTLGTLDAASSYYILGHKSRHVLPDRELLKQGLGAG